MRRDLVHVIRMLLDPCVLVRVQGNEEHFISQSGDVLYNINRPALAATLAVRRGASTIAATTFDERLAALIEEPLPDSDDGKTGASGCR